MKKIILALLVAGIAAAGWAQSQVDVGFGTYLTDMTGVYANDQTTGGFGQTAKYSPSLNAGLKYTYSLKIDDANTIKFGAGYDGWFGLYSGTGTNLGGDAGQMAGYIQPFGQWTGYGFDILVGLPLVYFSPADAAGVNTLKYAYSTYSYYIVNSASTYKASGSTPYSGYNFYVTNYDKVSYKISFDKTFWVSAGVEFDYAFSPLPWLLDLKPQATVVYAFAQLDCKYDYFNSYSDSTSAQFYDTFLEPKLTIDFAGLGVSGLKAYTASKISLTTTNPSYMVGGTAQNFHNTSLTPGASYKLTLAGVGDFTFEGAIKFNKIDNDKSGTTNKKDVAPFAEGQIKLGYTVKF